MWFFGIGHLRREVKHLAKSVRHLTERLDEIERNLASGLFPNPALQEVLQEKIGQTVTISTASATVEGILLTAGTDALEIRESTGDLVLIPYSRITVLQ
ncbi:hypothetical protein EJP77_14935 [Paenibacillus zeisoli]|uniref:DUF2642 domain-containing protein n=1 Tax=Paenibacillus zeisoli TaxID=2496267 RepID=A0A433X6J2_9BACL|nr:hypothetical protein [Paenibacillus zeisoli]RUT29658.1 hypothetical protein EJP77_14935 [Paenibacillus zeisoli]